MSEQTHNLPQDILWGVGAIAAYINRPIRQTYYLIAQGAVPVEKLGPKTIIARKSRLNQLGLAVGPLDNAQ